jgi:hypothetical protein
MSDPLPIIADVPSENPQLGFQEYAEALADAIRGGASPVIHRTTDDLIFPRAVRSALKNSRHSREKGAPQS